MSKKCRAYSESKLGLEPADNRKAFYAGWDAALAEQPQESKKFDPNESFAREEAAQARVREFMRNH